MPSSNELARRVSQRNPTMPSDRHTNRELVKLFRETGLAALKVDALEHIELKSMESIADVIDYARNLAGDDPVKAQILSERIRNYARRLDRAQGIFGG